MSARPISLADEPCPVSGERQIHLLTDAEEWAIKGAMAANRPLLIRGEPGSGKTQLALAAACDLNRPLVSLTVDSRTESRDLLWMFDAVHRLAEAQVISNIYRDKSDVDKLKEEIHVSRFVNPGPIWWALNWESARRQLGTKGAPPEEPNDWSAKDGAVVLIDEIDKADSDLPNGLLEAFGMRQFTPLGQDSPVTMPEGTAAPLIVVTTNEERVLPDAFVRRCFVLNMDLPDVKKSENHGRFVAHLEERGRAHFPDADDADPELIKDAAELMLNDRLNAVSDQQSQKPGQAEFLDFLRAIMTLSRKGEDPRRVFDRINEFVFRKSRGVD